MREDTTKSESKPIDRYKLKFTKHGMTLEVSTYDKRFGECISNTKYEYGELANVYNSLQNVTIHSIKQSLNEKEELDSLEFIIVDGENVSAPDKVIIGNIGIDDTTNKSHVNKTPSLIDSNTESNDPIDENCTVNPKVIITENIPTVTIKDKYMPTYEQFFNTVHYKRALLIMMGHSIEEIKSETGASDAMIHRGLGWYRAYGIIYTWEAATGDVIITSKGAALLQKEGLIERWSGNKIYLKCKN